MIWKDSLSFFTKLEMALADKKDWRCYLLNLPGQHTALDPEHSGDIDVLSGDGVQPSCETVQRCQEKDPSKLQDIKYPLDDVI